MNLTLKEARDQLYTAVVPNLSTQENVDRFNLYLNWAVERLINSGSWVGMIQPVTFLTPTDIETCDRHITLPPCFVSVLAMRYAQRCSSGVCSGGVTYTPVTIRNQWFSYTTPGPFCWDFSLWGNYGYGDFNGFSTDIGDGFVIHRDAPYASYRLKFTLENIEDSGSIVLIKGYDEDGQRIFTPSSSSAYEGMEAQISYPSTTLSQVFTKQIYFLGKPASQGYFLLDAVDTVTGESTRIGTYWPSDVNPVYHRYRVAKLAGCPDTSVDVLAKLRYTPLVADTDTVIPANLGALRLALAALVYESNSDPNRYEDFFTRALKLLNDETRSTRGGAALRMRIAGDAFRFQSLYPGR